MIIDSHTHFFESPRPGSEFTEVKDHLAFEDVLAQARAIGVGQIVQVTPAAVGYDNRYSFQMAEDKPTDILGVIARLDPLAPNIREELRTMLKHPKMLALRLTLIEKHNENWLAERALDDFFALAQDLELPVELFAPFKVSDMHDTVKRFRGVRWLIDHTGLRYYAGRDNRDAFRQWPELLRLAQEPHVWIKCTYFPEAAKDLEQYPFPMARDYFRQLYDHAGPERLIWGSNFPNVRRACSYQQALDFIRIECDFLSEADRKAILGENLLRYVARSPNPDAGATARH